MSLKFSSTYLMFFLKYFKGSADSYAGTVYIENNVSDTKAKFNSGIFLLKYNFLIGKYARSRRTFQN